MPDHSQPLSESARAIRTAAERVEREAGERRAVAHAAPALREVEAALHALGDACYLAGRAIVPPAEPHETVSARYARAAATWPGATAPSHEQQAQLLVVLHDAGAALHTAADCTARASAVLDAIVSPDVGRAA